MSSAIFATASYSREHGTPDHSPRRGSGRRRGATATRTTTTARPRRPTGATSTGARAEDGRGRRDPGQLRGRRLWRPRSRSCSCTGSAASGRTGSRTSRGWRGAARRRHGPARLRAHARAGGRREITITRLRPLRERALRQARARARSTSSATRWAATSPPRWRSSSRSGCRGSCSSPPPGISSAETLQAPDPDRRPRSPPRSPRTAPARYRQLAARPVTRHMSLALVARHPRLLKADLAYEGFFKGAGKPGFDDALRASSTTTSATACPR